MGNAESAAREPTFADTLHAARIGQDWAWHSLYRELVGPITGYLMSRGAEDPEDLAAEVFLHIARDIQHFEGGESSFRSWVFVIAHRRLIDARRTAGRRPLTITDDGADTSGGDVEEEALERLGDVRVQAMLDLLTGEQREVLALRVIADLSLKDTAQILDKDVGAVKALQRRAVRRLQRLLEEGEERVVSR